MSQIDDVDIFLVADLTVHFCKYDSHCRLALKISVGFMLFFKFTGDRIFSLFYSIN